MRSPWRNQPSAAERLERLATSGDLPTAMQLLLSGVTPDERVELARELLPQLPGIMGATVLGNSFTAPEWPALRDSMTAAERRPAIMRGLIANGREHLNLNLGLVPANTQVVVETGIFTGLIKHPSRTLPGQLPNTPHYIAMRAIGDGGFELDDNLYINVSDERTERFGAHTAVTLGGMQPSRTGAQQFTPVLRHGRPLFALAGTEPVEVGYKDPHGGMRACFVANVALDGMQVFCNPAEYPEQ
jgi:hypothetical protein